MSRPLGLNKRLSKLLGVSPSPQCESNDLKTVLKYTDIDNEFIKINHLKNNYNSTV